MQKDEIFTILEAEEAKEEKTVRKKDTGFENENQEMPKNINNNLTQEKKEDKNNKYNNIFNFCKVHTMEIGQENSKTLELL